MQLVEQIFIWLIALSPLVMFPPLALSIWIYNRVGRQARVVAMFVFLASATEAIAGIFWLARVNNLIILHVYTAMEFLILSYYYRVSLPRVARRWVVPAVTVLFVIFALYENIFVHGFKIFNTYTRGFEALILMIYAIWLYIKEIDTESSRHISSLLLINTGFFIYFSGTFFLFLFSNYLLGQSAFLIHCYWGGHALLMTVLYTLLFIGLWKAAFMKNIQFSSL